MLARQTVETLAVSVRGLARFNSCGQDVGQRREGVLMAGSPSMKDVAAHARVSLGTVSTC